MAIPLGYGAQPFEGGISRFLNGDTVTIQKGMIAVWRTASLPTLASIPGGGYVIAVLKSTASASALTVAGIALDDVLAGEIGEFCTYGVCEVQVAHGATTTLQVAANDSLHTSGVTAGKANDGTGGAGRFGYAFTAAAEKVTGAGYWVWAAVDCRRLNQAFGRS